MGSKERGVVEGPTSGTPPNSKHFRGRHLLFRF